MDVMRAARGALWAASCLLGAVSLGCTDLPILLPNVCGNYVIEDEEDCDGHAEATHTCAPPEDSNACHYICSTPGFKCPDGFGCGSDGVCRRPLGTFSLAGIAEGYAWPTALRTGDFDSDGNTDLLVLGEIDSLGRRPARALYTQGFSVHAGLSILPANLANPAIGAGAGDAFARDIAFADFEGVALLRAHEDRTGQFIIFPTISLPGGAHARIILMDALPDHVGDETVALIENDNGFNQLAGIEPGEPPIGLVQTAGGEDDLVSAKSFFSARFDETLPCGQVVFGYKDVTYVDIYTPCRSVGTSFVWKVDGPMNSIALEPPAKIDRGVFASDLNFDGHLDLVIGAGGRTYAAFGVGDGQFTSQEGGGIPNKAGPKDLPLIAGGAQGFPLAVADLNADGKVDYVVESGIFVSKGMEYDLAYENLGAAWSEALIANFNANDLPDVVAVVKDGSDVQFFNNAGNGVFGPATLSTIGPPTNLRAGDFDGDLLSDLVFGEALVEDGVAIDHLSFAFGTPFGAPSTPVIVGEVGTLGSIVTGNVEGPAGPDPMTEISVVVEGQPGHSDGIALLPGRASRSIYSTLPLRDGSTRYFPVSLAYGKFGDSTPDIVALGAGEKNGLLRLFRIEAFDEEGLMVPDSSDQLPTNFIPANVSQAINLGYGATVVAVDLGENDDDDDHDDADDAHDEAVVVGAYANTEHGAIAVARYDADESRFLLISAQVFDGKFTNDSTVLVDDLDGDGNQDLVVTTGTAAEPSDLLVVWGNGSGNIPPLTDALERIRVDDLGIAAVASVRSKYGKRKALIVSTPLATYLLEPTMSRQWTQVEIPLIGPAWALAVADFDHDGVDDLAVQSRKGLELYRSVPHYEHATF